MAKKDDDDQDTKVDDVDTDTDDDDSGDDTDDDKDTGSKDKSKTGKSNSDRDDDGDDDDSEKDKSNPDVDKWRKMSRKNEAALHAAQKKIKEFEDKDKTDSQRLQEERDEAKTLAAKTASELKRWNIAAEHAPEHATLAQLKKVAKRINGKDDDELEEDAKELWADFAPEPDKSKPKSRIAGKPKENLRGGSDPEDDDDGEMDPAKLAGLVPRAR